ncbi:NAD-dependent succinate-semialdehyde dehydrogenase [Variovorax terrae]|uniref:NAD-dependent succinate-semialdehyde dehydrogenase n=1 Tax=Variovorax terrae TaxID=2923278 RepID=A0A9X1VXD4_9BURK|nr:NAD-dependent succinate-semialdehyde dehydrogenase [Variovorax terrae]MCJ0765551.1 NAD-dependent succinate-semialdehyde dehydrogenase [Variovorax terrae]
MLSGAARHLQDPGLCKAGAWIGGRWVEHGPLGRFKVVDPATGEPLASLPRLGEAEALAAVAAAHAAFASWREQTAGHRAERLRRWFELMTVHAEDLARLITLEEGKPLAEARAEVRYAASFVQWFAEEARRTYGEIVPAPAAGQRILVTREPVGVAAAITPWNFPAAMITRKAAPALAAGCTMVVKPAEQTPLTALALAELAHRAGIPPGVFNVLTTHADEAPAVGRVLTQDPRVRKISFTGSTAVGKILLRQGADGVKKASMELGGNAPFIVFDDADLDAAVAGAMACKFRNTGQACISANRFLVHERVHDAFVERLTAGVQALKLGHGLEEGVQQGPLIDDDAVAKVAAHVADAVGQGARVHTGGRPHALGGRFYEPTVISGVTPAMRLATEETFGPVAAVMRFAGEDEAVALANDTPYGLAAYLYSRDAARLWRVSARLESGMVGINTGLISNEVAPFGGVKESGLGREGSRHGIEDYLEMKYLCWDGLQG